MFSPSAARRRGFFLLLLAKVFVIGDQFGGPVVYEGTDAEDLKAKFAAFSTQGTIGFHFVVE